MTIQEKYEVHGRWLIVTEDGDPIAVTNDEYLVERACEVDYVAIDLASEAIRTQATPELLNLNGDEDDDEG